MEYQMSKLREQLLEINAGLEKCITINGINAAWISDYWVDDIQRTNVEVMIKYANTSVKRMTFAINDDNVSPTLPFTALCDAIN